VDVFAEKNLPDFGYRYVQFDDSYQTGGGSPAGFLKWNGKFQGGVSLLDERWDSGSNVLSGKSDVVVADPYVMTVHLPEGFRLENAEVGGEKVELANQKGTAAV